MTGTGRRRRSGWRGRPAHAEHRRSPGEGAGGVGQCRGLAHAAGKPLFSRATLGLLRPKHRILGVDVVGQVEAVGSGVTRFKPGDGGYANLLDHGYGGFAEYASAPLNVVS